MILKYVEFLREEEKSHREYLEKLYTTTSVVLGVLVTVGVGLIGFLQFKTKKDVKEAVDARFHQTVDQEFRRSMEEFKIQLSAAMEQINRDVDQRVEEVVAGATQRFQELLFAAVPSQVEVSDSVPAQAEGPDKVGGSPEETRSLPVPPDLSDEEREILNLMDHSKFSFRSFSGLAGESQMSRHTVRGAIDSLTKKGLLGKTLGKKGGDRWFITEAGRKYLISDKTH